MPGKKRNTRTSTTVAATLETAVVDSPPLPPAKKRRAAPRRKGVPVTQTTPAASIETAASTSLADLPASTPTSSLPPPSTSSLPQQTPSVVNNVQAENWLPSTLRNDPELVTLHNASVAAGVSLTPNSEPDMIAQRAEDRAEIARLLSLVSGLQSERASERDARVSAERRVEEMQRQARDEELAELARRLTPIPRPSRPRGATWTWAKMEDILGLPAPASKQSATPTEKARVLIYHWILHVSRWVLDKSRRELQVDIGAAFRDLLGPVRKKMLDLFRAEVKKYAFLWPVFYHPAADGTVGLPRFRQDWPMKEMMMRTMKNERDGMRRPKIYAKEARLLLRASGINGNKTPILVPSVVRYNLEGIAITNLYNLAHFSGDDEAETGIGSRRARAAQGETQGSGMSEHRRLQLEKVAQEEHMLQVEDARWYSLDDEVQAMRLHGMPVMEHEDEAEESEMNVIGDTMQ